MEQSIHFFYYSVIGALEVLLLASFLVFEREARKLLKAKYLNVLKFPNQTQ